MHIIKNIRNLTLFSVLLITLLTGCSPGNINEDVFDFVWKQYMTKEFEESFDESQSTEQKIKNLKKVTKKFNIDYSQYIIYMKLKHPDKYQIFIGKSK